MEFKKIISDLSDIGYEIKKSKIPLVSVTDILINVGKKACIYTEKEKIEIGKPVSAELIQNIFTALCEYSVHAYKNEICEGFITSAQGIRTGICATAIYENEKIIGIKDISALNIRIPHEIIGAGEKAAELFSDCGILIIGPPCSGKTTLLRDISRIISEKRKTVIIDERFEIAAVNRGKAFFDVGKSAVMSGFKKSDGMIRAVRSMAPEVIVCDEFGGAEDVKSAEYAMKSGVFIIASAHALDKEDFISKPFSKETVKSGIFRYFIFLDKNKKIKNILSGKELFQ